MTPVLSSLLDASIRISLVAVLVTALVYGFRVRSSSLRHKAWLSVLAAMLLMPVLSRVAPRIAIPIAAPGVSEVSEGISPELHLDATTAAIGGSGGAAETISKGLPAPIQATSITPGARRIGLSRGQRCLLLYMRRAPRFCWDGCSRDGARRGGLWQRAALSRFEGSAFMNARYSRRR